MRYVTVVSCGPAVNESERKAIAQLKTHLISAQPAGGWLLLTNLPFSATNRFQSDEIDIIAIGPPGVRVIEVKHWSAAWVRRNQPLVEQEAERVTNKARKVGTTLRKKCPGLGRVDGVFLLTESMAKVKGLEDPVRGRSLPHAQDLAGGDWFRLAECAFCATSQSPRQLSGTNQRLATEGDLKRIGGYVRLELQTHPDERFHRVFKATHSSRRDRVILHLYDSSASDGPKAGGQGPSRIRCAASAPAICLGTSHRGLVPARAGLPGRNCVLHRRRSAPRQAS